MFTQYHRLTYHIFPGGSIALENVRIGLTESIYALFDIPNEEPISARSVTTNNFYQLVLGRVDILILVNKDEAQFSLPLSRQFGGLVRGSIPKQPQGVLLEVVKIQHAQLPFTFKVSVSKFPCKFQ